MGILNYFNHLKYILKHKGYVIAYHKQFDVPLFQALVHDWTCFLPREFLAYAEVYYYLFGNGPSSNPKYLHAWNHHQKHNKHHWQYWLVVNSGDRLEIEDFDIIPMPLKYVKEMILDRFCSDLAIKGEANLTSWFSFQKHYMTVNDQTMGVLENIIDSKKHLEGFTPKSEKYIKAIEECLLNLVYVLIL